MDYSTFNDWFAEANNDFEMGDILSKTQKYNGAVFHYIQSIEKALKALLYLFDEHPWGHSIINLLEECEALGISVDQYLKNNSRMLEKGYTESRYPDANLGILPKDAYDEALTDNIRSLTELFLNFVNNTMEAQKSDES